MKTAEEEEEARKKRNKTDSERNISSEENSLKNIIRNVQIKKKNLEHKRNRN